MSNLPEDEAAKEKRALELEKLRLDIEAAKLKPALELEKLHLDIDAAKLKMQGREPVTLWQRIQYVTIYVSICVTLITLVISYCTYRKSLRDAKQHDLQTALEHYQKE